MPLDGTHSNAKTSDSVLTMDILKKAMERVKPLPKFDVLVGHPEKVSSWCKELFERGITVHKSNFLIEKIQYFKPRTKKKRIQKKAKKLYIKEVPSNTVYLLDTKEIFKKNWSDKWPF